MGPIAKPWPVKPVERLAIGRDALHHLQARGGRKGQRRAEWSARIDHLLARRLGQNRPPSEALGDGRRVVVEPLERRRVVEVARRGQRLHCGLDVPNVSVEHEGQSPGEVAHSALDGLALDVGVVCDQPGGEEKDRHDGRHHEQDEMTPKPHQPG